MLQGDFVSLELRGGRVVFRYSMGDAGDQHRRKRAPEVTWHTVSTKDKYNTNEWVTALATFSKKDGEKHNIITNIGSIIFTFVQNVSV